jgi:hypothetical protein
MLFAAVHWSLMAHLAAFEAKASNGRYWSNNGQMWVLPRDGLFAYDPTATLAPFVAGAAPLFNNVLFCQTSYMPA